MGSAIRETVARGGSGARDAKMRLAREIVSEFHDDQAAEEAEGEFRRVFSERESPEETLEFGVAFDDGQSAEIDLTDALVETGVVGSKSEVRRLVSQGAIEADGKRVEGTSVTVRRDAVIRVGKHRFLRIVDASPP